MKDLFISLVATSILLISLSHNTLALECYSCTYISHPNLFNSDIGCELPTPPPKYKTTNCTHFIDPAVAGVMTHSLNNGSNQTTSTQDVCLTMKGTSDQGIKIVMRGCERNSTAVKGCSQVPFPFPGLGIVNMTKCYCDTNDCNGSSGLVTFLGISLLVPVIVSFAAFS